MHLSFGFAKSATGNNVLPAPAPTPVKKAETSVKFLPAMKSVYDSLHLSLKGLSQQAFDYAKQGFAKLIEEGKLDPDQIRDFINRQEK